MGYIYRLPNDYKIINHPASLFYFSIKKKQDIISHEISVYSKNEDGEGIFAIGYLSSDIVYKTTELPTLERSSLFERSFFQIKVKLYRASRFPLVDIKYLSQFPSYNRKFCQKPKNPYTLYWDAGLTKDISFIYENYNRFFSTNINKWKYYIHILREESIKHKKKVRKMLNTANKCINCGILPQTSNFLEIHDKFNINFNYEYVTPGIEDAIIVCPNCHKILHEDIINGN